MGVSEAKALIARGKALGLEGAELRAWYRERREEEDARERACHDLEKEAILLKIARVEAHIARFEPSRQETPQEPESGGATPVAKTPRELHRPHEELEKKSVGHEPRGECQAEVETVEHRAPDPEGVNDYAENSGFGVVSDDRDGGITERADRAEDCGVGMTGNEDGDFQEKLTESRDGGGAGDAATGQASRCAEIQRKKRRRRVKKRDTETDVSPIVQLAGHRKATRGKNEARKASGAATRASQRRPPTKVAGEYEAGPASSPRWKPRAHRKATREKRVTSTAVKKRPESARSARAQDENAPVHSPPQAYPGASTRSGSNSATRRPRLGG